MKKSSLILLLLSLVFLYLTFSIFFFGYFSASHDKVQPGGNNGALKAQRQQQLQQRQDGPHQYRHEELSVDRRTNQHIHPAEQDHQQHESVSHHFHHQASSHQNAPSDSNSHKSSGISSSPLSRTNSNHNSELQHAQIPQRRREQTKSSPDQETTDSTSKLVHLSRPLKNSHQKKAPLISSSPNSKRHYSFPIPKASCPSDSSPIFEGDLFLTKYFHNKRAAVSLTFDDGQLPQFAYAGPTLKKHNLRGTFFICPIFLGDLHWEQVDETLPASVDVRKQVWKLFEMLPQWEKYAKPMAEEGFHEFAAHTSYHKNFGAPITIPSWYNADEDFEDSIFFNKHILGYKDEVVTLAWPYGASNMDHRGRAMKKFIAARGISCGVNQLNSLRFQSLKACDFDSLRDHAMKARVEEALRTEGWLIEFMHSIHACGEYEVDSKDCPQGYGNVDPENWVPHLEYLQSMQNVLWVDTFGNITKYIKEQQSTGIEHVEWTTTDDEEQLTLSVLLQSDYEQLTHSLIQQPVKLTLAIPLSSSISVEEYSEETYPLGTHSPSAGAPSRNWPFQIDRILNSQITLDGEVVKTHREHSFQLSHDGDHAQWARKLGAPVSNDTPRTNLLLVDFLPQKEHLTQLDIVFKQAPCA